MHNEFPLYINRNYNKTLKHEPVNISEVCDLNGESHDLGSFVYLIFVQKIRKLEICFLKNVSNALILMSQSEINKKNIKFKLFFFCSQYCNCNLMFRGIMTVILDKSG